MSESTQSWDDVDEDRMIEQRTSELQAIHQFREDVARTVATVEVGYSFSGAANRLDVTEGTVKSRIEHVEDQHGHLCVMTRSTPDGVSGPLSGRPDLSECPRTDCRAQGVVSVHEARLTYQHPSAELKRAIEAAENTGMTHICPTCCEAFTYDTESSSDAEPQMAAALGEFDHWIARRMDKKPCAPWVNGDTTPINPHNELAHTSYGEASRWAERTAGTVDAIEIGFALTHDDPFVVIDLDDCRDPGDGYPTPEARDVVEHVDSYTEVSPSGRGIHIVARGSVPANVQQTGFEMYDRGQYVTVTFDHVDGTPRRVVDRADELEALFDDRGGEVPSAPRPESYDPEDAPETALYRTPVDAVVDAPRGENCPHPIHGSDTRRNFKVFPDHPEQWYCWRHECAGNVSAILAMRYLVEDRGVPAETIDCSRITDKWATDDHLVTSTWAWAVDEGLIDAAPVPARVDTDYLD